jgi:hypothetical protein
VLGLQGDYAMESEEMEADNTIRAVAKMRLLARGSASVELGRETWFATMSAR